MNGVSELISLSLGNRIDLNIVNSKERLFTYIDSLQLESSLLNLCMNSAHAIDGDGHIDIVLEQSEDNMVLIHVHDDGCGMDRETVIRAVEPFYSTRRGSSGTGLGLSIVYGFFKQSGGDMQIKSTVGTGTTVTLSLHKSTIESIESKELGNRSEKEKTVLVVEDEVSTLEHAVNLFQTAGYEVTQVCNYDEASRIIISGARFSLLFTDLHLGMGQTGWDLANICLQAGSAERIVVTSGRLSELSKPPHSLCTQCHTLAKPYNLQDILSLA